MNLLLEMTSPEVKILSESIDEKTGDVTLRVAVKWQHADIVNHNGRRYPRAILQREIERLAPDIKRGAVFACGYHPKDEAEVADVAALWESVEMKSDGACVGVIRVLPTSRGRDAQILIKNGGHIGMSSRGFGTTTPMVEKGARIEQVNGDYKLKSPGDFVLSPSVDGAGIIGMFEAKFKDETTEPTLENFSSDITRLDEQQRLTRLRHRFNEAVYAGYPHDFETYCETLGNPDWLAQQEKINKRLSEDTQLGYKRTQAEVFEELSEKGEI